MVRFAILLYHFNLLIDIGALHIIINSQFFVLNFRALGIRCKFGRCSVKRECKQFISIIGSIDNLKAELFGKCLVGKSALLFFCPEHANTGFTLGFGIRQAIFHQRPSISVPFGIAVYP